MLGRMHDGSARKVERTSPAPAGCPVHEGAGGVWHVQGYPSSRAALRSAGTRQAGFGADNARKLPRKMRVPVLWRDGPDHREHRRQTARFFTPRRVDEKYRELMHSFADEQVARLLAGDETDVSRLSFDLAVAVAGQVVGLTNSDRHGMASRLDRFFREFSVKPGFGSPEAIYRLMYSNTSLALFYFADVRPAIRARKRERQDDLISHLIDDGASHGDIFGECLTFAAAGMITTREFITIAAWHLFTDPGLREAYTGGDRVGRLAILHEILRLEPVVGNLARWADEDIEVPAGDGTATIPRGARIDIAIATANLDPVAVGPDGTQVCPARSLADGVADSVLAFGDGPHKCPGAHIAIQESEIFLTKLFAVPGLRMVRAPRTRIRAEISSYELQKLIVAAG
ncbi:MAG: cytochrome [Actinomycetia bacterium]|nr:cytochrome [Actinomycetes bacterium]